MFSGVFKAKEEGVVVNFGSIRAGVGGVANRQNPKKCLGQNDSAVCLLKTFRNLPPHPPLHCFVVFGYKNVDKSQELIHTARFLMLTTKRRP